MDTGGLQRPPIPHVFPTVPHVFPTTSGAWGTSSASPAVHPTVLEPVTERDGRRVDAQVLPESTVFSWLVVLRFLVAGERRTQTLTLFPDQMSRDEFRMLCVCLRWNLPAGKRDEPGF